MNRTFMPSTNAGLLEFGNNASTLITATPLVFGVTSSFATSFASSLADYASALTLATGDATKGKVATANMHTARATFRDACRQLNKLAHAHPGITGGQLTSLGLIVRSAPTPQPPPGLAPEVLVKSVNGRLVRGTLKDASVESKRRRPINAKGAIVLTAYGMTPPPSNDPGWQLQGNCTDNRWAVQFSNDIPAGTPCYVIAMWYTERGEYSPASEPTTVYLATGSASEEEAA